ncbi:hypothetical protein EZV76_15775 [Flagellimonas alvinocaridis]|uniref:Uncharacterized protein n=1 Tax=Flagellimonas alvinocaridis TaxID=2530200 RepID=A0A4V4HWG4_9FLAO|nr:hypothetical protein [Allomuricauda alvinocaridis]THV57076.1 hypothetical protein EZV76_15775 [Allomuricauda alvinocaridis]
MISMESVLQDCQMYIDFLQKCDRGYFLTRGVLDKNVEIVRKEYSVAQRKPKTIGQELHDSLNMHFNEIFGWPVRNGLFCYGIRIDLEKEIKDLGYGKTHLLFPCGEFRYIYDPDIFDLASFHFKFKKNHEDGPNFQNFIEKINYLDSGLSDYISKVHYECRSVEVMLNCTSYYLLDLKYSKDLIPIIWGA